MLFSSHSPRHLKAQENTVATWQEEIETLITPRTSAKKN